MGSLDHQIESHWIVINIVDFVLFAKNWNGGAGGGGGLKRKGTRTLYVRDAKECGILVVIFNSHLFRWWEGVVIDPLGLACTSSYRNYLHKGQHQVIVKLLLTVSRFGYCSKFTNNFSSGGPREPCNFTVFQGFTMILEIFTSGASGLSEHQLPPIYKNYASEIS